MSFFTFQISVMRKLLYLDIVNKSRQMLKNEHDDFQKKWPLLNLFPSVVVQVGS